MINDINILFFILLPVVAFLYSSVGHGGASGYLALMVLFGISTQLMRPMALILNVMVSVIAFIQFYRVEKIPWKLFFMLMLFSAPAAFFGGLINIDPSIYKKILGILLLIPAIRFSFFSAAESSPKKEINWFLVPVLGVAIGFLSGLIGIGGGIILSPVLLILSWTTIKETATLSALFIACNSIAGLIGNLQLGIKTDYELLVIIALVTVGGLVGGYTGANHIKPVWLNRILTIVIGIACFKLFNS